MDSAEQHCMESLKQRIERTRTKFFGLSVFPERSGIMEPVDIIRGKLSVVVNEHQLSLETLHKVTGVSITWLSDYLNEKNPLNTLPNDKFGRFFDVVAILSDGMKLIDDDDRIKGVIDVLVESFGVTYDTLSILTGLEQEEIDQFMQNPSTLDYNKKYRLATKSLFLHYVFKDPVGI